MSLGYRLARCRLPPRPGPVGSTYCPQPRAGRETCAGASRQLHSYPRGLRRSRSASRRLSFHRLAVLVCVWGGSIEEKLNLRMTSILRMYIYMHVLLHSWNCSWQLMTQPWHLAIHGQLRQCEPMLWLPPLTVRRVNPNSGIISLPSTYIHAHIHGKYRELLKNK